MSIAVVFVPNARVTVTDVHHDLYAQTGTVTSSTGNAHSVSFDNGITATLATSQLAYGVSPANTPQPEVPAGCCPPVVVAKAVQLNDVELMQLIDARIIALGGGGGSGYFDTLEMKTAIQNNDFYVDADGNITQVGTIDGFLDASGVAAILPLIMNTGGKPLMPADPPTATGQALVVSSTDPQELEWGAIVAGVDPAGDFAWTGNHSWSLPLTTAEGDAVTIPLRIGTSGTGLSGHLGGFYVKAGTANPMFMDATTVRMPSVQELAWTTSSTDATTTIDIGLKRSGVNTLAVTDGMGGAGNLTAASFAGDGSALTNVTTIPDLTANYDWTGIHTFDDPIAITGTDARITLTSSANPAMIYYSGLTEWSAGTSDTDSYFKISASGDLDTNVAFRVNSSGDADILGDLTTKDVIPDLPGTYDLGRQANPYASVNASFVVSGDGTTGSPGIAFLSDPDTGIHRSTDDEMKFISGGVPVAVVRADLDFEVANNLTVTDINSTGDITAVSFTGDGSGLTNLPIGLTAADIDTLAELNAIITDATLIDTGDARLSDARTPTAHTHLEADITDLQSYLLATDIDTLAELNAIITDATLIDTGDSRLSDARTPTAHTHLEADITDLQNYLLATDIDTLAELNAIITDATLVDVTHTHTLSDITDAGTAAASDTGDFATAAQGALADSAIQAVDIDTLGELNAIISDATLIDTLDSRLSDTRSPSAGSVDIVSTTGDLNRMLDLYIGNCLDSPTVTLSESGGTVSLNLENNGGGDLRFYFSDGVHTHDCTPTATVALTAGTDTSPQLNYVYILQSNKTLTASTVGWPATEYVPIATAVIQSAASFATDGAYKVHAWTDHVSSSTNGHLCHVNYWIRQQPASWISGTLATVTDGVGTFDIAVSAGTVLQLHSHAYPGFDTSTGSEVLMVNDPATPYKRVANLTAELTDAASGSLSGQHYNLVFWGVVSEETGDCQLMCNLPTGSYNNINDAISDIDATAVYTIGSEYRGTGFLIARITMQHQVAGGGTFTEEQNTDLRGSFPSTAAGGGIGGGASELVELTDVDTAAGTANFVLAAPDGVPGNYSGRLLVVDDIPSLTLSKISDAGTAAASATGDFATAAQGALADSAIQTADIDTLAELNAIIGDATLVDGWTDAGFSENLAVGDDTLQEVFDKLDVLQIAGRLTVNDHEENGAYYYYGGTLQSGAWKINRYTLSDSTKTSATVANNPTKTTYSAAWTDRLTLTYA